MQFIQSAILILIGAVIGSALTLWGRLLFAKRTEYYRQRPLVKKAIENTISKVANHNHPFLLLEDSTLNGCIDDILKVMSYCK